MKARIEEILRRKPMAADTTTTTGTNPIQQLYLDEEESKIVANFIQKSCQPRDALTMDMVRYAHVWHNRLVQEQVAPVRNSVWAALIRGYGHLGHYRDALAVLHQMAEMHATHPELCPSPPHAYHYSTVLHGCAVDGSDDAAKMAEQIIAAAQEATNPPSAAQSSSHPKIPGVTIEMYNNLLLLYAVRARRNVYGAAAAAEDWLIRITQRAAAAQAAVSSSSSPPQQSPQQEVAPVVVSPNATTFNLVLRAWKDTPEAKAAERAHGILNLLCQLEDNNNDDDGEDDSANPTSFGTVIAAYTARGQMDRAEQVLDEAVQYYRRRQQRQEQKAQQQQQQQNQGRQQQALVDDKTKQNKKDHEKSNRIDLTQCFNEVCYGWAKQGREDLILAALHRYDRASTTSPHSCPYISSTHVTHGACLEALLRNNDVDGAEHHVRHVMAAMYRIRPTRREYASVLTALTKAGQCARAAQLWREMVERAEMRGWRCFPEPHDLTQCLDALRRHHHAAAAASAKPTTAATTATTTTATTTTGLTLSEDAIAQEMMVLAHLGHTRRIINAEGFAIAINFLCHVNRAEAAGDLLGRMEHLADATTNFVWPVHYAAGLYTAVVAAFARAAAAKTTTTTTAAATTAATTTAAGTTAAETTTPKEKGDDDDDKGSYWAAEQAYAILSSMPRQGPRAVLPTIRTYTAAIVALRHVPSRRSAELVKELYKELKSLDRDPTSKVRLDTRCFEQILWTMEGSQTPKYTSWALTILMDQIKLYMDNDRKDCEPTSSCFNATIRAQVIIGYLDDAIELIRILSDHHEERQLRHFPSKPVLEWTVAAIRKKERMLEAQLIEGLIDKHFPNEANRRDVNIKIML